MTYTYCEDAPERFSAAFNRLAASKAGEADEINQEAYFETFHGLPIEAVEEAGQRLQREPTQFLPSAGVWFALADELASKSLEADHAGEVKLLADGRSVVADEQEKITTARSVFVAHLERVTGRTLPDTHPMKCSPTVPTYACLQCLDTGWVNSRTDDGYGGKCATRCHCIHHNPVLERARATNAVKRSKNRVR